MLFTVCTFVIVAVHQDAAYGDSPEEVRGGIARRPARQTLVNYSTIDVIMYLVTKNSASGMDRNASFSLCVLERVLGIFVERVPKRVREIQRRLYAHLSSFRCFMSRFEKLRPNRKSREQDHAEHPTTRLPVYMRSPFRSAYRWVLFDSPNLKD